MSQIFYRQILAMPSRSTRNFRSHRWRRAGCPNSPRRTWRRGDHPVGCHFSGCECSHYRYSFGRRSNRFRIL